MSDYSSIHVICKSKFIFISKFGRRWTAIISLIPLSSGTIFTLYFNATGSREEYEVAGFFAF